MRNETPRRMGTTGLERALLRNYLEGNVQIQDATPIGKLGDDLDGQIGRMGREIHGTNDPQHEKGGQDPNVCVPNSGRPTENRRRIDIAHSRSDARIRGRTGERSKENDRQQTLEGAARLRKNTGICGSECAPLQMDGIAIEAVLLSNLESEDKYAAIRPVLQDMGPLQQMCHVDGEPETREHVFQECEEYQQHRDNCAFPYRSNVALKYLLGFVDENGMGNYGEELLEERKMRATAYMHTSNEIWKGRCASRQAFERQNNIGRMMRDIEDEEDEEDEEEEHEEEEDNQKNNEED